MKSARRCSSSLAVARRRQFLRRPIFGCCLRVVRRPECVARQHTPVIRRANLMQLSLPRELRRMPNRPRVPVWLMGLTNLSYGLYGGVVAFAVPQLLGNRQFPKRRLQA